LDSPCRHVRMEAIETRYKDHPRFWRARESLERLSIEVEEELQTEQRVMDCYGDHLNQLHDSLLLLSEKQIRERYSQLKSDIFSTSMAFFSSISEQLSRFERRVKSRLRDLPADLKTQLLNYMRDWWIQRAYPMLQEFIDKLDRVAKLLGVESYQISLNYPFISVSFTFKSSP